MLSNMEKTVVIRKCVQFMRKYWSTAPTAITDTTTTDTTTTDSTSIDNDGSFRFFTYQESEKFLNAAVVLASNSMISEETLLIQYMSQMNTGTIRDGIRMEYIASEVLSRI